MKTILFISKDPTASSTRYRATDFIPLLYKAGWNSCHWTYSSNPFSRLHLLKLASKADAVIIIRRCFGVSFSKILRRLSKKIIFTFDDAIFAKSSGAPSPKRLQRFKTTLKVCDHVWAGNKYLADFARQYNDHVSVIPTAVDLEKYNIKTEKPTSTLDLVWVGSHSTKKHLVLAIPALEAASEIIPNLRLKVISDFSLSSDKLEVICKAWSSNTEAEELASSHIGIAPLPDNAFTRGKCGLKIIQYMAAGLPVISSNAGLNKEIVEDGVSGFLVNSDKEWIDAIIHFFTHKNDMRSMGMRGKELASSNFSIESAFERMLKTL